MQMELEGDTEGAYEMAAPHLAHRWRGTEVDRQDMSVLGRVQELRVS